MTALSDDRTTDYCGELPRQFTKPLIAAEIVYHGALVGLDSSGNAGPAGVSGISHAIGVAMHRCDNSAGSAGDKSVRLQTGVHSFTDDGSTTEADLPAIMYAVDDQTVSLDSAGTRKIAGLGIMMDPDDSSSVRLMVSPGTVADALGNPGYIAAVGTATLVAGVATVTTPDVRADSLVVAMPKGLSGSTDFSYLDTDTLTAGVSFTLEAKTIAHAADTDAVGDVMWILMNP